MRKTINDMYDLFNKKWALVASGQLNDFNVMTVSWGSLGTLWSRDIVTIYIKPCRYTHQFMEKNEYLDNKTGKHLTHLEVMTLVRKKYPRK